jgi:hypothetical protein
VKVLRSLFFNRKKSYENLSLSGVLFFEENFMFILKKTNLSANITHNPRQKPRESTTASDSHSFVIFMFSCDSLKINIKVAKVESVVITGSLIKSDKERSGKIVLENIKKSIVFEKFVIGISFSPWHDSTSVWFERRDDIKKCEKKINFK